MQQTILALLQRLSYFFQPRKRRLRALVFTKVSCTKALCGSLSCVINRRNEIFCLSKFFIKDHRNAMPLCYCGFWHGKMSTSFFFFFLLHDKIFTGYEHTRHSFSNSLFCSKFHFSVVSGTIRTPHFSGVTFSLLYSPDEWLSWPRRVCFSVSHLIVNT